MTLAPFWLFYAWMVLQHVKENVASRRVPEAAQIIILIIALLLAILGRLT